MKEISIGGKTIRVRATPLALLYYKQAFRSDLIGDMAKMRDIQDDPSQFDSIVTLQMIWAMARADSGLGSEFPSFESWLGELELDFNDKSWMTAAFEEAADGFFRSGRPGKR